MAKPLPPKTPRPVDSHVGARIRLRRGMIGMTQEVLGRKLGITFQQVQKYEKGANRVGASRLQQIANILQVTPAFFFEGAPAIPGQKSVTKEMPSPAYVTDFISSADGLALMKAFTRIKDRVLRRRIVELVNQIAP